VRQILHLSDVHFGPPHLDAVSSGVLDLIADRRPHLVVVSGDLTQRAKPEQFRAARRFVDAMQAPSIVVPGNHDVPMYRVWERLLSPLGAYRKHFSADLEPIYRDEELVVVGINSAFNWTVDNGRIVPRQVREVGRLLAAEPPGLARLAVIHHPFTPPPRLGRYKLLRNAAATMEMLSKSGVEMVLCGHQHQAYVRSSEDFYPTGRPPVRLVHSGTSTSDRGRGGERGRNSCNWITIDGDQLTVERLFWEPGEERFRSHARLVFPRRGRHPSVAEYSRA